MQRYSVECDSSWLDVLQGSYPLLKGPELKFVSDVCSAMKTTMPLDSDEFHTSPRRIYRGAVAVRSSPEVNQDPTSITKDFKRVVDHLRRSSSARMHFLRTYVGWRISRDRTVTHLVEIADSIDKVKENCEAAKIIASGLSLLGGGLCLFASEDDERRNRSREIGSAMMGIGNIATAGASAFGTFLLHKNIQEAKEALEEDREHLEGLWTWYQDSGDLLRSLDNIKKVERSGNLQTVANKLQSLYDAGMDSRRAQSEMRMILKSVDCPPWLTRGLPDVVGMLVATNMLCERFSPLFKLLVQNGSDCLPRLRLAVDLFRSASGVSTALSVGRNWMTSDRRDGVINGMCLDAVNMVLSAAEIDTKSAESEKIREAVDHLTEEADSFERLYETMKRMNSLVLD